MPELPAEVLRLIGEAVSSMDHVDLLFHLTKRGETTVGLLAADTHLDHKVVVRVLGELAKAGLVVERHGRFGVTGDPRNRAAVELLAEMYNARPVSLVRAVYARTSPITTFADAFRLRPENEE